MVVKRPTDYEPAPVGKHLAVCAKIYNLGLQPDGYKGKPQHKCVFIFELEERRKDGTRFTLTKEYTASLADKSYLRRDLEAWRGSPLSAEELAGFDLDKTIGKGCLLTLVAIPREGRNPFIDIDAIEQAPAGTKPWPVELPGDYVPIWVEECLARRLGEPVEAKAGTF